MPKKSKAPKSKPKSTKKSTRKVPRVKKSRNPKQTTRRIPAQVGARSRANITEVVAPSGSRGGQGAYRPRRTPQEIAQERRQQALQTLGISDFPVQQRPQTTRQAPQRIREPVGGFTGLTEGYGIRTNNEKKLNQKLEDMEARLRNEIQQQNQANNPAQQNQPVQRNRPQRAVLRRPDVDARRPPPEQELESASTFIAPEEQARQRAVGRVRDQARRTRQIYTPQPVTEEGERREKELEEQKKEEKRIQDIRDELERQKQAEAQKTINRILKDANKKVKEKQRKEAEDDALFGDVQEQEPVEKKRPEPAPEPSPEPAPKRFVVGGEGGIEVPFGSQEELLQAFRNRPNQPKPIDMTPQPRTDIPQPTQLTATEPLFLQDPESRKKVLGEDTDEEDFEVDVEPTTQEVEKQEKEKADKDAEEIFEELEGLSESQFVDVSGIEPPETPKPVVNLQQETRTQPTSQRQRPRENDPQNVLNVSSLRRDIVDSFGESSLRELRRQQAEEKKIKEQKQKAVSEFGQASLRELRRQEAERERLRTRPLPPTPEREIAPPPPRDVPEPSRGTEIARDIVSETIESAFDTATRRAEEREKQRREQRRKEREEERKQVASGFTSSLIRGGISGALSTEQRRDRGQQRQQRDKQRRSNLQDVGGLVDDLVDRSIVQAQAKETQVRATGQGRKSTDIETEVRRLRQEFGESTTQREEEILRNYRDRLEERATIQDQKNQKLGALMNFGVNGEFIPFNARDLIRITNQANDRQQLIRLRDLIRNDSRPEVRNLEREIMRLANDLIDLKKEEKDKSNKIAKLKKSR